MEYMFLALLIGCIAGGLRVGLGYLKNSIEEAFDWDKALRTLLIGIITGGIIGFFYPIPNPKELFAVVFLGTVTVEELLVTVSKKLE